MTSIALGFTLVGPFFFSMCVIFFIIVIAWNIRNGKNKEFCEKLGDSKINLSESKLKILDKEITTEKLKKLNPKDANAAKKKKGCCKDNGSDCSDEESGIGEIKIYYGSVGGKAKVGKSNFKKMNCS